jgi:hypothetical protein
MHRGDERMCDGCGQKLPPGSKLSEQMVPADEAARFGSGASPNPDGSVTIDLCLQCRILRADRLKRGS